MKQLRSSADGFEFDALHLQPRDGAPDRGGIIVLQEIFGLDAFIRQDAQRWADAGFEVLAPSLFDRAERGFVAEHDQNGIARGFEMYERTGWDTPVEDVRACAEYLGANGPVFVVGYCYGGSIAWRAAAKVEGLAAAGSYYGGSVAEWADLPLLCPVICHFGRKDPYIAADDAKAAIEKVHPEVPVYIYEQSGHGFNNEGLPDADPNDAAAARRRTLEFFERAANER